MIIDTSVIVAGKRGTLDLEAFLRTRGTDPVAIAAITASELLHGYHRAADAGTRARRAAFVEALLNEIQVLPFGLPEARRHAELWAELLREGSAIGPHDMLIAATALAHGHAVATLDRRAFARVRGLQLAAVDEFVA